jgi:predicted DNA-binding transcriptional regulator YafY
MPHPSARVLAVLELLQAQAGLTGAELAERLGIDRRTVRRYIATLEEIGIPVTAERGRNGGYALMPGFKLPPLMFTDDEALALALGLLAARTLGVAGTAPASASAAAKLERVMPESLKQHMRAIEETVVLELPKRAASQPDKALATLSAAALTGHRVHLRYRAADGADTGRELEPYGLAFHAGSWYVVGMCYLRGDIRTFRLDRIVHVAATALPFPRPVGFDVLGHLRKAVATLPRAFSAEVVLDTELETARSHLHEAIGVLEQTPDGIVLHNQSDDLAWLARQLASLPFDFVVRKPARLRAELATLATRLRRAARSP